MRHPFDLANLIAGDHNLAKTLFARVERNQGNRQVLFDQINLNVAVHAGGEEQVFYPALTDNDRKDWTEHDLEAHQKVKNALIVLDNNDAGTPEAEAAMRIVIDVVREHLVEEEQTQLPWLREQIGDDGMHDLGEKFQDHQRKVPTHSHPHSPSNPIVATPAALVDKMRDKRSGRAAEVATDASGLLDAQAQELIDTFASLGIQPPHLLEAGAARKNPTLADAVEALLNKQNKPTTPEPVGEITERHIPGLGGDVLLRIYRPADGPAGPLPVLVYVHGGGWVIADIDVYDASARALANGAQCLVVSVEYRKAPENKFPAAHDDVLSATYWVLEHADEIGGDANRVAIGGESAGANMAATTAIALRDANVPPLVFQMLVYPVASTSMNTASYGEATDAKPLYSGFMNWFFAQLINDPSDLADTRLNLLDVNSDQLAGLPPALVITAGRDPLRDEGESFATNLTAAGVDVQAERYEGMMHEFFGAAAVLDKAADAQQLAAVALRTAFSGGNRVQ